jgi:hypothetical protein
MAHYFEYLVRKDIGLPLKKDACYICKIEINLKVESPYSAFFVPKSG